MAQSKATESSLNFSRDDGNPVAHKESFKRTVQYDTACEIGRLVNNKLDNLP